MDKEAAHRYKVIDDRGTLEFLWNSRKRPTARDFNQLIDFFKSQHPDLGDENELSPEELEMDLDKADQSSFEKIRRFQESRRKAQKGAGGALLGRLKGKHG